MRPLPMLLGSVALLGLGVGGGFLLGQPGTTEAVSEVAPTERVRSNLPQGTATADSELTVLRQRVRDLEDELDDEVQRTGDAEVLHVGRPVRRVDLGAHGMQFEGTLGDEITPEMAEQIAAAVGQALGAAELDCEGDDCIMVGPDGMPLDGVQIQTMGDIDPAEIEVLLQQAMSGEGGPEGAVGVMIIDAAVEIEADE